VLFSEPKIPQSQRRAGGCGTDAEFQCSSASRKFLNCTGGGAGHADRRRFSALQRAENSSMDPRHTRAGVFFCFSALQRAENSSIRLHRVGERIAQRGFSALQRAENSSILPADYQLRAGARFSALQRAENSSIFLFPLDNCTEAVSVLFSEPKIPQFQVSSSGGRLVDEFQCSSASRKFLNPIDVP